MLRKSEETAALVDPTILLVLGTLFLIGAYGIHLTRAHADKVAHVLIPTALSLFLLVVVIAVMQRAAGRQDAQVSKPAVQRRS